MKLNQKPQQLLLFIFTALLLLSYQNCGKVVFTQTEKAEGGLGDPVIVEPEEPGSGDEGTEGEVESPEDDPGSGDEGDSGDGDGGDDSGDDSDDDDNDDGDDTGGENPGPSKEELINAYCDQYSKRQLLGFNMLRNSGFERRDSRLSLNGDIPLKEIKHRNVYGFYESLPFNRKKGDSWHSQGAPIEVQPSGLVIDAFRGQHLIELDSNDNAFVYQDVIVCEAGTDHVISFAYAPRGAVATSGIKVRIGENVVAELYGEHQMEWKVYRYKVSKLSRGIHRLSLEGLGHSDGIGALVDRVRMKKDVKRTPGVITILLALGDHKGKALVIDQEYAKKIARNAVRYASLKRKPKILLVKDRNHNNESRGDAEYIAGTLLERHDVTLMEEPPQGLKLEDTEGYDVVWLNNPGHPVGKKNTVMTLMAFTGGIVISGDDAARGRNFNISGLTGLKFKNNGASVNCGGKRYGTDNNGGIQYGISMERFIAEDTDYEEDVSGYHFYYGNDIDHAEVLNENVKVIATAGIAKPGCEEFKIPAIVGYRKSE